MCVVRKQMVNPKANGKKVETIVHFTLLVSLYIVKIVVEQGLCSRLNNIRFTAVSVVHPPARRISPVWPMEALSIITPAPAPTPVIPVIRTVSINMVGITISLAGMADRKAHV